MRLSFVAHGPTTGTRSAVFGDTGCLLDSRPAAWATRGPVFCGPEPACVETAIGLLIGGGTETTEPVVLDGLRGPDFGDWRGLALDRVLAEAPGGIQQWLRDPDARPHGGESLAQHLARVAGLLESYDWPARGAAVATTTFTLRAACLHALGAGPLSLQHLDVAPGALATITRHQSTWRLRSVAPPTKTPGPTPQR